MEQNNSGYSVYITTDRERKVLDIGVAGSLNIRLKQLECEPQASKALESNPECIYLLHWEKFQDIFKAIDRESAIKKLSKKKKIELINNTNPEWRFLNEEV